MIKIKICIKTYSCSGGEIFAMHVMIIVIRTTSPPPMRSKKKERRAALVAHV